MKSLAIFCLGMVFTLMAAADSDEKLLKANRLTIAVMQGGKAVITVKDIGTSAAATQKTVAEKGLFSGSVMIHGQGGAPTGQILINLKEDQTPQNHADIWIIEGGINDIKIHPDPEIFWTVYNGNLAQIALYAKECGAKLYLQEMTPVTNAINESPYWMGLDVPGKLPKMNGCQRSVAAECGQQVIALYDSFLPYWKDWNSEGSTVHPNETGVDKIAQAWTDGIKPDLTKDASIYVAGDSIVNAVPPEILIKKIDASFPNAVNYWESYE